MHALSRAAGCLEARTAAGGLGGPAGFTALHMAANRPVTGEERRLLLDMVEACPASPWVLARPAPQSRVQASARRIELIRRRPVPVRCVGDTRHSRGGGQVLLRRTPPDVVTAGTASTQATVLHMACARGNWDLAHRLHEWAAAALTREELPQFVNQPNYKARPCPRGAPRHACGLRGPPLPGCMRLPLCLEVVVVALRLSRGSGGQWGGAAAAPQNKSALDLALGASRDDNPSNVRFLRWAQEKGFEEIQGAPMYRGWRR